MQRTLDPVQNPARLQKLKELDLLDTPTEAAFDRLTQLASKIIGAPVSLVSLVDSDRQFFKSFVGLEGPAAKRRETPLSHSFCQHVVASGEPLVVSDARKHPVLMHNRAVPDLNVIAYLGIPLQTSDGQNLGSFCVIDGQERHWTPHEIEIIRELAMSVMTEIELRAQVKARQEAEKALEQRNRKLTRVTLLCDSTLEHMQTAIERSAEMNEIYGYVKDARRELAQLTE